MQLLFLDLASQSGLLACVTEAQVVASDVIDHRMDDAELMQRVEQVIKNAGWTYGDLAQIACVVGPGGFTSLRVAVALANALASQLHLPVAGIHLSDVYQCRMADGELRKSVLWLHSTKKTELFIRDAKKYPEPVCITVDDLRPMLQPGMQWMGELIPEHQAIVRAAGCREAVLVLTQEILPNYLGQQKYSHEKLTPWYGRGW